MFKKVRGLFSKDLSVDLGTANTLIYSTGAGVVLNEPSVVAIRDSNSVRTVAAVGTEAKKMLGRTPGNIKAIRPLKDGVIADFQVTEKMLQYFISKVHRNSRFIHPSPRVLICVPCKATQVEKRAIKESALGAGAREVYLIAEPLAAAIGAGLPIDEAAGSMVLDIGGGTTEIAIMTLGGAVYSNSVRVGGDRFDENIIQYIRKRHNCIVGEVTAERIKHEAGTAFPDSREHNLQVRGRSITDGIPKTFNINSREIYESLTEPLASITDAVRGALEHSPPELSSDIAQSGIVLTGGGALLSGIDRMIAEETGLAVIVAEDPLTCVARGGGEALRMIDSKNSHLQLMFSEDN